MLKQLITQQDLDHLFDDISYLEDEAEALKYLIDKVPYEESPPEGKSIFEMLRLIDYAQHHYFRPIIERVLYENRTLKLSEFEHFNDSFTALKSDEETDVQRVLNKIIKHRAALRIQLDKISRIDWERTLRDERGEDLTLYDFVQRLITNERSILKNIADLVLVYQNELHHQREINKKVSQRNRT